MDLGSSQEARQTSTDLDMEEEIDYRFNKQKNAIHWAKEPQERTSFTFFKLFAEFVDMQRYIFNLFPIGRTDAEVETPNTLAT